MEYKILEANGVENENIDGAAFNNFISSGKDGIIEGVLNECDLFTPDNLSVHIATGELLIQGFRIKITDPVVLSVGYYSPSKSFSIVATIELFSDRSVDFKLECIPDPVSLKVNSLFRTEYGIYQVVLGTFEATASGIRELRRSLPIIAGSQADMFIPIPITNEEIDEICV